MMIESDEKMRCPKCKKIAVRLVPINDNHNAERVCLRCKNKNK